MLDDTLRLVAARTDDPPSLVPLARDLALPTGFEFPGAEDLVIDTNGDGVADAAALALPVGEAPPGAYTVFAALLVPGSAAAGDPVVLGLALASFEVRDVGRASASGAAAITADGARVFVANPDSDSVSLVDTRTDEPVAEVVVGTDPRSLALGPGDRHLYVTGHGSATLTILSAESLSAVATFAIGAEPYGVVADLRGHLVYVASSALAAVEVVDVRLRQVIGRIPVGPKPRGSPCPATGAGCT